MRAFRRAAATPGSALRLAFLPPISQDTHALAPAGALGL
jgi:hypothetical protein